MPQAGSQIVSPGSGACTSTIAWISGAGREVLAGAALGVLGVLLQQALVGVALHVGVERRSTVSRSIRSTISRRSLAGSWILFCALRKMMPSMPVLLAQLLEDVAVVRLQLVAVLAEQARPVVARRGSPTPAAGRLRPLVGHLEEQQSR